MFKVGDKVILKNSSDIYSLELNKVYIIKLVAKDFIVVTDKYGTYNWYAPQRFVLYLNQERKEKLQKLCSKLEIE